jgi:hypothetical protein
MVNACRWLARALGLSLLGAASCNSILGIDPANVACQPDDYCCVVMENCTGTNSEYLSVSNCQKFIGQTDGDVAACRLDAAKAAASNPTVECPKAGPLGDCPEQPASDICNFFCSAYQTICDATGHPYDDGADDCISQCSKFKYVTAPGGDVSGDTYGTGDTLNCRMYHIENAASIDPTVHCPHAWVNAPGSPCAPATPADSGSQANPSASPEAGP